VRFFFGRSEINFFGFTPVVKSLGRTYVNGVRRPVFLSGKKGILKNFDRLNQALLNKFQNHLSFVPVLFLLVSGIPETALIQRAPAHRAI
jgi:hypothetical protein